MTSDETPATMLQAIRGQADRFVVKPFAPGAIVEIVQEVLASAGAATLPIEVISARPEWVELVAPCALPVADRLQSFMMRLDADLPEAVRESVGRAFRELLCNAIEWGGKLDPNRRVRISCIRARRMVLYRIADPGEGFDIEAPGARGHQQPRRRSPRTRLRARGDGPPPRRAGAGDHPLDRRRADLQRGPQRSGLHQVPWTEREVGRRALTRRHTTTNPDAAR